MTILDSNTVAVDTFTELKTVLEGDNAYTTVYLTADIAMTSGIAILPTKAKVTIDGLYPPGSGTVHTLTEYKSSSASHTLGVRSASSIQMSIRNMNIVGENYYGILYVPESASYAGVTVSYENITYVGPQITYNPCGKTRYIDCDITVQAAYSPANEVGEVYRVEIGGATTINHTSTGNAAFWFRGSATSPALSILPGAEVTLTTEHDVIYTGNPVTFTVGEGASFIIDSRSAICRSSSHRFASVTIGANATFDTTQTATNSYATLYCNGAFTVQENATVIMRALYTSARPLIYFYDNGTGDSLTLNHPKDFALYSSSNIVMSFSGTTNVTIAAQQVNEWSTAASPARAGGIDDIPQYSWRKSDGSPVRLAATMTSATTKISSHNFTDEELALLPPLVYLMFGSARTLSAGDLPLSPDPVGDDGSPVTGSTRRGAAVEVTYTVDSTAYTLTATADDTGHFEVDLPAAPPVGTVLTLRGNIPFLITTVTIDAAELGELAFAEVPGTLVFVATPIARNPVLLGREEPGWTIRIADTRLRGGNYYLYASIDGPLTGDNPAHTLPGSLIHRDGGGAITPLSGRPTLVHAGVSEPGGGDVTVAWAADAGPLLRTVSEPFYSGERYTAPITWTLSDTVLDT